MREGDNGDFSDRADPEPDGVVAELATGRVEWYGGEVVVESWLPEGSLTAEAALALFA